MTHVWDEIEFRNQGVKFLLYAQEIVHGLIHKDKVEHLDSSPVAPQSPDIWGKNFLRVKAPPSSELWADSNLLKWTEKRW